jgi:hypothetical protein
MVCNRVAVQTCLSLLIAAGAAHASDSEAQDRTHVPGVEIWLGTNRVTPPRTAEIPTPRMMEPAITDQAVSLRSRRNQQDAESNPVSDTIPVWRLPARPGSSGVETRLSGEASEESAEPSVSMRAIAFSEIGDLPVIEESRSIGEAIRLLNESIELNQRAAAILKSLTSNTDCVGCSFEQAAEGAFCTSTLSVPSMLPKTNAPARAISAILTDSPTPAISPHRRDQPDGAAQRQDAAGDVHTSLRIRGEQTPSRLLALSPSFSQRPGLGEVALLVAVLLVAIAASEAITQARRARNGWSRPAMPLARGKRQVGSDSPTDEPKLDSSVLVPDLVAAVIAQNVRLRRRAVEA